MKTTVAKSFCVIALVLLLVVARLVFRRALPATLAAAAIVILIYSGGSPIGVLYSSILAAVCVGVTVRFGVVAQILTFWTFLAVHNSWTRDFDAWHGQAAIMTLAVIASLAAYGYWASTAGWVSSSESPDRQVPK